MESSGSTVAGLMDRVRTPFNVNEFAQQAARIAFRGQTHVQASAAYVQCANWSKG